MESLIGRCLWFVARAVACESNPENLGRDFDMLHRLDAMALIIVVRHGQGGIRLTQQVRGC